MKKSSLWFGILFISLFWSCNPLDNKSSTSPEKERLSGTEKWRATIQLNDSTELPFSLDWFKNDSIESISISNGDERIESNFMEIKNDSIWVSFPVFANYLIFKKNQSSLNGFFVNPDHKGARLSLTANKGINYRFENFEDPCCKIDGKWAVKFSPKSNYEYPAIAHFFQKGNRLSGTFLTETGDYRYLEGNISGEDLNLSTFDGAHLFLFKGKVVDGKIRGHFYSGESWYEPWIAVRSEDFQLRNSDSLTFLKDGFEGLEFSFPNFNGELISIDDERYKNKPVIVQLMGSWCPNCMDESRYLKSVYEEYHPRGLEIISLAFERMKNERTAFKRIGKLKKDLNLPYPILLAGSANKKEAAKALPMLNHIMSYPTAIYLNKNHEIVKIHTGFSGPGTPLYQDYVKENKILLEELVK